MSSRVASWVSTTSPATSSNLLFGMAKSVHVASSKCAFSKRVAASCRFLSWLSYSPLTRSITRCRSGSPSGVATSFCPRGATRRRATGGSATGGSERRRCAAVKGVRAGSVLSGPKINAAPLRLLCRRRARSAGVTRQRAHRLVVDSHGHDPGCRWGGPGHTFELRRAAAGHSRHCRARQPWWRLHSESGRSCHGAAPSGPCAWASRCPNPRCCRGSSREWWRWGILLAGVTAFQAIELVR